MQYSLDKKLLKKEDVYKGIKQKIKYYTYIKAYIPDDNTLDSLKKKDKR